MRSVSSNFCCLIFLVLFGALFLLLIGLFESLEETNKIQKNESKVCKFPKLDVNNPEVLKFIHDVPPLQCSPDDWVIVDGSQLIIQDSVRKQFGQITCIFKEILRVDEDTISYSGSHESNGSYTLQKSDFVDVKCRTTTFPSEKKWHSVLAGVRSDPNIQKTANWKNLPAESLKLNVLMFGFDSLSRNTFIRKLPKTYKFLIEELDTQVLEGYNIIGDGTPQALIPILTGKTELELPNTRKSTSGADFVDVYPLIWKEYKKYGYVTGFMEDVHHIGTFTYRLKGFKTQPTDHYMRSYYIAAAPLFQYSKKFCMGGEPRHMVMMNYIKNIFNTYGNKPRFVFGFHGELSHDSYNDIGAADKDLLNWVKILREQGHLDNTILILMSDHGHRFAEIRNTLAGKQEERLPFFSFTFPPWFKTVHPVAYENFVHNTKILTTPFDIHKTLQSILKMDVPKDGDIGKREISLFDKIPLSRTCDDAFIEAHWCTCLNWEETPTTNGNVVAAVESFINLLNDYTEEHRDICEKLKLEKILWSAKLLPNEDLLKFKKSQDHDGFLGDFSANTQVSNEIYQIKVLIQPGGGIFEASVNHNVKNNVFSTKIAHVSRINQYGSQARCVENEFYDLRKYCYCKDSV